MSDNKDFKSFTPEQAKISANLSKALVEYVKMIEEIEDCTIPFNLNMDVYDEGKEFCKVFMRIKRFRYLEELVEGVENG